MKKLIIVLACLLLVCGCKDVKLDNGESAVVTFKDGGISSKDLYEELKKLHGGEAVTNLIDLHLLNKDYPSDKEEEKYVDQTIKTLRKNAKDSGTTVGVFIQMYYGLSSEEALETYLSLNYKKDQYTLDYAKENVSEKQINDYYKDYIYGDVEASHILITVDAKEDDDDTKKTEAENKALETANNIIKQLNEGADFAELAKKYSKDKNTASNGGSLGKVNTDDLTDEALTALRNLQDGTYTTTAIKSSDGYHILYRTSMDEKPALEDVKEEIIEKVAEEMSEESGYTATAMKALREKNEMTFVDTDLEKQFENLN